MRIPVGVQVSLDYNPISHSGTWYKLTDHNRQPIQIGYEVIETSKRMANGTMRKYVISKKIKASTDWQNLPTLSSNVVDYYLDQTYIVGGSWIKAFYESNAFNPIYVKIVYALDTTPSVGSLPSDSTYEDSKNSGGQIFKAYMTAFTYDVLKRTQQRTTSSTIHSGFDYVNAKIEFTEI